MSNGNSYLLDSHALLWWWFDPDRLSGPVRELLSDPATPVFVSAASVWELSLKNHQGKLPELNGVITDIPGLLQADGFEALPISLAHGLRAGGYSQPHRDPFDRLLVAQSIRESLTLLSADGAFVAYGCPLWDARH